MKNKVVKYNNNKDMSCEVITNSIIKNNIVDIKTSIETVIKMSILREPTKKYVQIPFEHDEDIETIITQMIYNGDIVRVEYIKSNYNSELMKCLVILDGETETFAYRFLKNIYNDIKTIIKNYIQQKLTKNPYRRDIRVPYKKLNYSFTLIDMVLQDMIKNGDIERVEEIYDYTYYTTKIIII